MANTATSVALEKVSKSYGTKQVFRDFSCRFDGGRITSVLGKNGSGKTTLLRLISTILTPDAGIIQVGGHSTKSESRFIRQQISCSVSLGRGLLTHLTVAENISLYANLLPSTEHQEEELRRKTEMECERYSNLRPHQLSSGMKQFVLNLRALTRPAKVYLFDEPYAWLDEENVARINNLFECAVKGGATIIISAQEQSRAQLPKNSNIQILGGPQ